MPRAESILHLWASGFVNRWHTHDDPRLRNSQDTTAAHQQRVAILVLSIGGWTFDDEDAVFGEVFSALFHDAPEVESGDLPYGFKRRNAAVREQLVAHDEAWFEALGTTPPAHSNLLKLCDGLDAIMFVRRHAPEVLKRPDWSVMIQDILEASAQWDAYDTVRELIFGPQDAQMEDRK